VTATLLVWADVCVQYVQVKTFPIYLHCVLCLSYNKLSIIVQ